MHRKIFAALQAEVENGYVRIAANHFKYEFCMRNYCRQTHWEVSSCKPADGARKLQSITPRGLYLHPNPWCIAVESTPFPAAIWGDNIWKVPMDQTANAFWIMLLGRIECFWSKATIKKRKEKHNYNTMHVQWRLMSQNVRLSSLDKDFHWI